MEFKEKLSAYVNRVEKAIEDTLPTSDTRPARIHEAMLYSMRAGGKRIRPVLALAACELFDDSEKAMPAAIALECLHTYSLIHDDLPGIDDSELRRGLPTSHVKFDVSTAILAGDSLLTYAFQILSRHYAATPVIGLRLVSILAETAGSERLIGGQIEDIAGENKQLAPEETEYIHLNKTSALIEACLEMGALIGGGNDDALKSIREYGRCIGLGFQVVDDILDATSDSETLGKPVKSDEEHAKSTYVTQYGLEKSRLIAIELKDKAIECCRKLPGDTSFLTGLANYLNDRIS